LAVIVPSNNGSSIVTLSKLLLLCGIIGGPLFVIAFLVLGAARKGYDPMRQPVSALAMGPNGWLQQVNFWVTGALMLGAACGLRLTAHRYSLWGPLLIGVFALGLLGAGLFVTDITGLSGTPERSLRTRQAVLHDLFSFIAFVSLIAACFVFSRLYSAAGRPGWSAYCAVAGALLAVGFVLFARGFSGSGRLAPVSGLLQRLTIAIGWLWVSAVCTIALTG
jgi:hypothetical protein